MEGERDVPIADLAAAAETSERPHVPTLEAWVREDTSGAPWPDQEPEWQPPVRPYELVAVVLLVVLCDLTIYRGQGFTGYACLFLLAPILLWLGSFRSRLGPWVWIVGAMLIVLAAKTIWCGSWLLVAGGFALLAAVAMSFSGQPPYVLEMIVFASQAIAAAYKRLIQYGRYASNSSIYRAPWLSIAMPLGALIGFGLIFILANPDLLTSLSRVAEQLFTRLRHWILKVSLNEIAFWIAAAWISIGLVRQVSNGKFAAKPTEVQAAAGGSPERSYVYSAFRNTLVTVIVLFAVYLVFEFHTLWFREFPKGFHYSGYAHEGAAWLTFALGLATVVLSLVFRGSVLWDPRVRGSASWRGSGRRKTSSWPWPCTTACSFTSISTA